MWVVEFESISKPKIWVEYSNAYTTKEEALVRMVAEKFRDPDYQYRIREVE